MLAGVFFGFLKIMQSKKVVKVSVAELGQSGSEIVADKQREVLVETSVGTLNKQEETITQEQVVNKKDVNAVDVAPKKTVETNAKVLSGKEIGKNQSRLASWGFQKSSSRSIKAIIVHTSYNALGGDVFDFEKVVQEWKDAGVAPHYAIDRAGTIFQLVDDGNIAWHAGASKLPDGTIDVNGVSIGIEVINSKDENFTDPQYDALNSLISDLKKKYSIKYVLGHSEIAPGRKTDPWGIKWDRVSR